MENILDLNSIPEIIKSPLVLYCCFGFLLLLYIILVLFMIKLYKNQKTATQRIESFMGPIATDLNLEKLLVDFVKKSEAVSSQEERINTKMQDLENALSNTLQKVGIVRYNPFPEIGGDLSYSIALLDRTNSGFVITSIYSRQSGFTYLKPISQGKVNEENGRYRLSEEENEAVRRAMQNKAAEKKS